MRLKSVAIEGPPDRILNVFDFLFLGSRMNHQMMHPAHGKTTGPHAGHNMPEIHTAHDRHAGHSVAMFRDKFWLSFALTLPVVFWSSDVQHWLGYRAPSFPGSNLIAPVLGTVVFVYGGPVFVRGAWGEVADRKPGMMTSSAWRSRLPSAHRSQQHSVSSRSRFGGSSHP